MTERSDPLDPEALAELAQGVVHTARDEQGLVKATAGPHGVVKEIQIDPALHDVGHATAAAEILAVVKAAQELADADYKGQIQGRLAASMRDFGGASS
jgi:DNA-binding protein YbaB